MENENRKIAFALGGLAGNNAHGAGFLHTALNHPPHPLDPIMISCTSGQIYWVYQYLQARTQGDPQRVQRAFMEEIEHLHRFHNINLDYATVALQGRPGVFRPAFDIAYPVFNEYTLDLYKNSLRAVTRILSDPVRTFWAQEILRTLPARQLVPLFPDTFFSDISKAFNNEQQIGIAFNSYCPETGEEYVYLNDVARKQLSPQGKKYQPGYKSATRSATRSRPAARAGQTIYQAITPEAMRDALWIYEYGFDKEPNDKAPRKFVDGAYYRQIMLKELTFADVIFVARPINQRWLPTRKESDSELGAKLPQSYIELQDLKTEINFNGSYVGERAQIALINRLVDDANNPDLVRDYHHIDLVEIEIQEQRNYFDYIFESPEVFEEAGKELEQQLATEQVATLLPGPG